MPTLSWTQYNIRAKNQGFSIKLVWIQIVASLLTSSVTLDKLTTLCLRVLTCKIEQMTLELGGGFFSTRCLRLLVWLLTINATLSFTHAQKKEYMTLQDYGEQ